MTTVHERKTQDLFTLGLCLFRCSGFVFSAIKHILRQPKLCGLRLRPAMSLANIGLTSSQSSVSLSNVGPLFKAIEPMHCSSIEAIDDITTLLADRLSDMTFSREYIDVPLADSALLRLIEDFLILPNERMTLTDVRHAIASNTMIMPELLLLVLEVMHPTARPVIQLCKNSATNVESCPDLFLRLWRHTYLQIPLLSQAGGEGIFGSKHVLDPENITGMPLWLETFRHLFVTHCSDLAVEWQTKYRGAGAGFAYGSSNWTPQGIARMTEQMYDGWIWMLATLYWILQTICGVAPNEDSEFFVAKALLRHFIAAIRIIAVTNHDNDSDNTIPVCRESFNYHLTGINECRYWKISPQVTSLDVSSPRTLLSSLQSHNVIRMAEWKQHDSSSQQQIKPTIVVESISTAMESWRYLTYLVNQGIDQYLSKGLFF